VCPGSERKEQYWDIIVPWMKNFTEQSKQFYTVKGKESVVDISNKFDVPVWKLWRMNPDVNLPLQVGDKLRVKN
jgi:spore germination protein YaaH